VARPSARFSPGSPRSGGGAAEGRLHGDDRPRPATGHQGGNGGGKASYQARSDRPRPGTGSYQGRDERPRSGGGYQGRDDRRAGGGYRGRDDRPRPATGTGGGYQARRDGPRPGGGYQGSTGRPRPGYQGRDERPRPGAGTGGDQGRSDRPRPATGTGGGYQGRNPRSGGGYQARDERPRPGYQGRSEGNRGYQGREDRPRPGAGAGGYQGRSEGNRADRGYQGRDERPRPGYGRRDGNSGGRSNGSGYQGRPDPGAGGRYQSRDRTGAPPAGPDLTAGRDRTGGRDGATERGGTARNGAGRPWQGEERRPGPPVNPKWGSVARHGARAVTGDGPDGPSASELWRQAVARSEESKGQQPVWAPEETWVLEPEVEAEVQPVRSSRPPVTAARDLATGREGAPSPGGARRKLPKPVVEELSAAAGADRGAKLANRIADATYAYEKERYQEARRILRSLSEEVPESNAVRELYGLVLYRTGQWAAAAKQLEEFKTMSGSYDQHPVLADCYRALHRYREAEDIWNDLREASPSGDLVAEGRIVAAGCKADQGDLAGAIIMLEKASRKVANPQDRHLRQWYALADLYERAGDVPRARDLFNRVASIDSEAFDVRSRLRALR
jgi:hypothetical protein